MKTKYALILAAVAALGIAAASGPVIQRLRDLYDVRLGILSNNDVLQYSATAARWTNAPAGTADLTGSNDGATTGVLTNMLSVHATNLFVGTTNVAGAIAAAVSGSTNLPNVTVTNDAAFLSNVTVATNLTVGGQVLAAAGDVNKPSFAHAADVRDGLRFVNNNVAWSFDGTTIGYLNENGIGVLDGRGYYLGNINDVALLRDAANTLAQRNGTVAQTNRIYGTWTDASNGRWLSLMHDGTTATVNATGNGTGGANHPLKLQTAGTGALTHSSGTADRLRSEGGTVTLTDNTATTVATFAVATNAVYGSKVFYTIRSVGTDFAQQAETGELLITGVNVDGTITSAAVSETSIQAVSAGTLTTDWTVTASGNTILLQCDADSDLTSPAITVIATFVNSFGTITRP